MATKSLFPPCSLGDALLIAETIWQKNAGEPMRRLTLFDILGRSPESSTSRQLVTASYGYGLTRGGYHAETIELTERGRAILERNDAKARLDVVLGIDIFRAFFERYRGAAIPSEAAAIDFLKERGVPEKSAPSCLKVLLASGKQVALVQEMSGVERIVSHQHALEKLMQSIGVAFPSQPSPAGEKEPPPQAAPFGLPTGKAGRLPSLNVNIQIHLPADAKPDVYEAIFKNIREYLMGEE